MFTKKVAIIAIISIVALSAVFLMVRHKRSITLISPTSRFGAVAQFSYPASWSVESDPAGFPNVDPLTIQSVLLRAIPGSKLDVAMRFWDNPNNSSAENWAKNAALEAELKRKPTLTTYGSVKFWVLTNAAGPVPSQTSLYTQFQKRIMQIDIDSSHIKSDGTFDDTINLILKSFSLSN